METILFNLELKWWWWLGNWSSHPEPWQWLCSLLAFKIIDSRHGLLFLQKYTLLWIYIVRFQMSFPMISASRRASLVRSSSITTAFPRDGSKSPFPFSRSLSSSSHANAMRSELYIPTLRDQPASAQSTSHALLLRGNSTHIILLQSEFKKREEKIQVNYLQSKWHIRMFIPILFISYLSFSNFLSISIYIYLSISIWWYLFIDICLSIPPLPLSVYLSIYPSI